MGDNIRLCNDKSWSKCDAINAQTQYDKETLLNIKKSVQKDFRPKHWTLTPSGTLEKNG